MLQAQVRDSVRVSFVLVCLVVLLGTALATSPLPARAQAGVGPRILHLPMRWCVLEGTTAAKRGDAAVLDRIRRGSSILAPESGITLRSAFNRSMAGSLGFPVIKDPRPNLGRVGDVRVPTESTGEFRLVMSLCEAAWKRLEARLAPGSDFGGVARGPVAVIIGDFVDGAGRRVSSVWGYAFSVSASGAYCEADDPTVRRADGGQLMVVDTTDGEPSALLDRRLMAHEVGHILRLGHGDGIDNRGSVPGRIDKFCDDSENPDIVPGSLMSRSLRFEKVLPWQRRLPRRVAVRHPAVVEDRPLILQRPPRTRVRQLERIANGGSRIRLRLLPPGHAPMTPLPRLRSAGVRGADFRDDIREGDDGSAGAVADLEGFGVSEDERSGEVDIWFEPRGAPGGPADESEFVGAIDRDGDPRTGGDPARIPGAPVPMLDGVVGLELVSTIGLERGQTRAQAWWWDEVAGIWSEVEPPPLVRLADVFGSDDEAVRARTGVMTLPPGVIELSDRFGMAGQLRTLGRDGKVVIDGSSSDPADLETISMSLEAADYPVCAVNRDSQFPGSADPGGRATLEAFGFGEDGPVSIWLADGEEPVAQGDYWEIPDDPWPWVAEIEIPLDAEAALQMVQVVFDGSGMTADCPVLIGDGELVEFDP